PLLEASPHPLALATLFEQATTHGETALAESCRARLQALAGNRNAGELRLLALQSLLRVEWPGQEDWFLTLFADPSLNGAEALMLARQQIEEELSHLEEELSRQTTNKQVGKLTDKAAAIDKLAASYAQKSLKMAEFKGGAPENLLALA